MKYAYISTGCLLESQIVRSQEFCNQAITAGMKVSVNAMSKEFGISLKTEWAAGGLFSGGLRQGQIQVK